MQLDLVGVCKTAVMYKNIGLETVGGLNKVCWDKLNIHVYNDL